MLCYYGGNNELQSTHTHMLVTAGSLKGRANLYKSGTPTGVPREDTGTLRPRCQALGAPPSPAMPREAPAARRTADAAETGRDPVPRA